MTVIKAYYDGNNFIPLQHFNFKPRQQVLIVVDEHEDEETPAQKFLKLAWAGNESADEILSDIEKERVNSSRFGESNALFASASVSLSLSLILAPRYHCVLPPTGWPV